MSHGALEGGVGLSQRQRWFARIVLLNQPRSTTALQCGVLMRLSTETDPLCV